MEFALICFLVELYSHLSAYYAAYAVHIYEVGLFKDIHSPQLIVIAGGTKRWSACAGLLRLRMDPILPWGSSCRPTVQLPQSRLGERAARQRAEGR